MSCTDPHEIFSANITSRESVDILDLTLPSIERVHQICKSDRIIAGYASVSVPDKQRDLFPPSTLRKALERYLSREGGRWRNLMIQHQSVQIGEVLPHYRDSRGKVWKTQVDDIGLFVVASITKNHVFADAVWSRIENGELDSFSIRGVGTLWKYANGCNPHKVITDLELYEITVSASGINPYAKFQIVKSFQLSNPLSIAQEWANHGHTDEEGAKWPFCLAKIETEEKKNLSKQEPIPREETEEVGVEAIEGDIENSDPVLDAISSLESKLTGQLESLTKAIEGLKAIGQIELSRTLPTPSERRKYRRRLTSEPRKPKVGTGIVRANKKPEEYPYPEDKYPKPKKEEEAEDEEKAKKKEEEEAEDEEKAKRKKKLAEEEEEAKKDEGTTPAIGPEEIKEMVKSYIEENFPVEKRTKVPVTGEITGSNKLMDLLKMDNESLHRVSWEEIDRAVKGEV